MHAAWLLAQQVLPALPETADAARVAWLAAGFVFALVVLAGTIAFAFRKAERSVVTLVKGMISDANRSVLNELEELNQTARETTDEIKKLILSTDRQDGRVRRLEERMDRVEGAVDRAGERVVRLEGRADSLERRLDDMRRPTP